MAALSLFTFLACCPVPKIPVSYVSLCFLVFVCLVGLCLFSVNLFHFAYKSAEEQLKTTHWSTPLGSRAADQSSGAGGNSSLQQGTDWQARRPLSTFTPVRSWYSAFTLKFLLGYSLCNNGLLFLFYFIGSLQQQRSGMITLGCSQMVCLFTELPRLASTTSDPPSELPYCCTGQQSLQNAKEKLCCTEQW